METLVGFVLSLLSGLAANVGSEWLKQRQTPREGGTPGNTTVIGDGNVVGNGNLVNSPLSFNQQVQQVTITYTQTPAGTADDDVAQLAVTLTATGALVLAFLTGWQYAIWVLAGASVGICLASIPMFRRTTGFSRQRVVALGLPPILLASTIGVWCLIPRSPLGQHSVATVSAKVAAQYPCFNEGAAGRWETVTHHWSDIWPTVGAEGFFALLGQAGALVLLGCVGLVEVNRLRCWSSFRRVAYRLTWEPKHVNRAQRFLTTGWQEAAAAVCLCVCALLLAAGGTDWLWLHYGPGRPH